MDKKVKKEWLAALRSKKYKQTTGVLRKDFPTVDGGSESSYCCLGVLCDVLNPKGWQAGEPRGYTIGVPYGRSKVDTEPSEHLLKKVGLSGKDPERLKMSVSDRLIDMNDNDRKSFKQIANWIEKYL